MYSDLSNGGEGNYPVVKVIEHPRGCGDAFVAGSRCATVSLYRGTIEARRWEDFNPKLVTAADGRLQTMRGAMERIPEDEWKLLEQALLDLPKPWKPGLYPCLKLICHAE